MDVIIAGVILKWGGGGGGYKCVELALRRRCTASRRSTTSVKKSGQSLMNEFNVSNE